MWGLLKNPLGCLRGLTSQLGGWYKPMEEFGVRLKKKKKI